MKLTYGKKIIMTNIENEAIIEGNLNLLGVKSFFSARNTKSKLITNILCESIAVTSELVGEAIRQIEKSDPDFFSSFLERKEKPSLTESKPEPEKSSAKPTSLVKRFWKGLKRCFTAPLKVLFGLIVGLSCNSKLKKCGCYVPFSTAKSLVDFHNRIVKKKPCKFALFWDYVKFWNTITIVVFILGQYLRENDLTLTAGHRTYKLCRRFIKAITKGGHPERTFEQMIDLATARRRDVKLSYFNKCEGGIFTESVEEIIIVFLQFGPECSKILFGSFSQLTENVDPDVKRVARRICNQFLERTKLKPISDIANHTMRTLLEIYSSKMRKNAKTYRNIATAAKWTYARQKLIFLSSLKPIPENDQKIERLVHEFAELANLAGANSYNDLLIDGEDVKYEVPIAMAAKILGVNRKTIERWEKPNSDHPCPVPSYDKKLRLKNEAFMGWVPHYQYWKKTNKNDCKGRSKIRR